MARSYSNRGWSRRGRRANIAYLVVALALFALIVFVLFRGHGSEPQLASAGDVGSETNPVDGPVEPASPAADAEAQTESATPGGPGDRRGAGSEPFPARQCDRGARQAQRPSCPADERAAAADRQRGAVQTGGRVALWAGRVCRGCPVQHVHGQIRRCPGGHRTPP